MCNTSIKRSSKSGTLSKISAHCDCACAGTVSWNFAQSTRFRRSFDWCITHVSAHARSEVTKGGNTYLAPCTLLANTVVTYVHVGFTLFQDIPNPFRAKSFYYNFDAQLAKLSEDLSGGKLMTRSPSDLYKSLGGLVRLELRRQLVLLL